jgi:hypothetical protein
MARRDWFSARITAKPSPRSAVPTARARHFIRADDRFVLAANVEHVCAAIMLKQ